MLRRRQLTVDGRQGTHTHTGATRARLRAGEAELLQARHPPQHLGIAVVQAAAPAHIQLLQLAQLRQRGEAAGRRQGAREMRGAVPGAAQAGYA